MVSCFLGRMPETYPGATKVLKISHVRNCRYSIFLPRLNLTSPPKKQTEIKSVKFVTHVA